MYRGENKYKLAQRHVWLRLGTIDIDITANQFSSTNRTVFVEESSKWHERFRVFEVDKPDVAFDLFDEFDRGDLIDDYKKVLEQYRHLKKTEKT